MIKETLNLGIVDVLEITGFDYFVIDMEHARYGMETIADILQAARPLDVTVVGMAVLADKPVGSEIKGSATVTLKVEKRPPRP